MQLQPISFRRTGLILLARGGLIQTPFLPVNDLVNSAMLWAHAADLTIRDKRAWRFETAEEDGGRLRVEDLEKAIKN